MIDRTKDNENAVNKIMEECKLPEKDRFFISVMITGAYQIGKQDARKGTTRTSEVIKLLKPNQIAQCVNPELAYPLETPLDIQSKFDNPYCIKKYNDGSIHWLKGMQSLLLMGSFIVEKALWELESDT